jgi:hypothetical protein
VAVSTALSLLYTAQASFLAPNKARAKESP